MDMNNTQTILTESVFSDLYSFVLEMTPDLEMCLDYCESQGITITDDVFTVIEDLLENNWSPLIDITYHDQLY
jgi:hypothetical protein